MIERRHCFLLICDECPDDGQAEESEHEDSERDAERLAQRLGWLAEGDDHHVCPQCQQRRRFEACEADGGHEPGSPAAFSGGSTMTSCRQCGHIEVEMSSTGTGEAGT